VYHHQDLPFEMNLKPSKKKTKKKKRTNTMKSTNELERERK